MSYAACYIQHALVFCKLYYFFEDLLAERLKHFEEKPSESPITTARARLRQVKTGINSQKDILKVVQFFYGTLQNFL